MSRHTGPSAVLYIGLLPFLNAFEGPGMPFHYLHLPSSYPVEDPSLKLVPVESLPGVYNPWPMGRMARMAVNAAQHKTVHLLKTL